MRKIKAIIADNDPDLVSSLSILLEQEGIEITGQAHDGEQASKLYSQHKPDVILLDLNMPNYDGHYAIEKIIQEDPNAKIIVISAYLDKHFQPNKVSAVFSKPYDVDEIEKKL